MRDRVIFFVNGVRREVGGREVFGALSSYLRETLGLTGTKVVCAEGDCGSCTVLVGRARGEGIEYVPVCGCIQYVYQMDGRAVVTVEGLKYGGELNPVQEAMVEHQGAQCGYCTPGFVVAMTAALDCQRDMTEGELKRCLVGNLCRCTGYESILKAGMHVEKGKLRRIESLHDTAGMAAVLREAEREAVEIWEGEYGFSKPVEVAEAVRFKAENLGCVIVSGGTDVGVQANKLMREVKVVLSTGGLLGLEKIAVEDGRIVAGARVSLSALERVALKELPEFGRMMAWFGSPLIKNAGTIGGNVANGSPIGDTMPGMFVMDGEVELTGVGGVRPVNINAFYTGYRRNVMLGDEMVTGVVIPLLGEGEVLKIYKVSKRKDLDISTVMMAVWMRATTTRTLTRRHEGGEDAPRGGERGDLAGEFLPQSHRGGEGAHRGRLEGVVGDVRIAVGGVGATVLRMRGAEGVLRGRVISEQLFREAGVAARGEIRPLSDVRGGAEYRLRLVENLLMKFYAEVGAGMATRTATGT